MNNEPVAWMHPDGKFNKKETWFFNIPLYTRPADLTDEEILDASALGDTDIEALYMIEGVKEKIIQRGRAVLRKAQEK